MKCNNSIFLSKNFLLNFFKFCRYFVKYHFNSVFYLDVIFSLFCKIFYRQKTIKKSEPSYIIFHTENKLYNNINKPSLILNRFVIKK